MANGYIGKILRVDLSKNNISVEEPKEEFYRTYLGGRGLISYYLLKELKPGVDPLGPDNKLIFAAGVITGTPVGGSGRNSVGAKSPLTGGYGDAEVGGYWGAELKAAGYDAIIVEGKADKPVYLWVNDGKAELRDASHLWGKTTGESQALIRQELGDTNIRTAQIGPAGEKMVRFACILNDLSHAAGRTGMGAVMGSKNLKAIACRGHNHPPVADVETVKTLAKWLVDTVETMNKSMYDQGTAGLLFSLHRSGGLPTRNFQMSQFEEGVGKINGRTLRDTILTNRRSCFGCPVHCKREVKVDAPYKVDPMYGGPEYETIASLGSYCGIDDLPAIAKGNELCNAYGMDTISAGASIGFAMECAQQGILNREDTDGLDLKFGNAAAMVQMVEMIANRQGFGNVLADGVARASQKIGRGAERFALHIKGQEVPMHEPRWKQGLGLGYIISPTGADHCHNFHDHLYTAQSPSLQEIKALGLLDPLPTNDLSPAKVRMVSYFINWRHLQNCLVMCQFVHFDLIQTAELVKAITGWNTSLWELMKVGERSVQMTRAFNVREGLTAQDDRMPQRFFTPLEAGPNKGVAIDPKKLDEARSTYYGMMGWDQAKGAPGKQRLEELGIGWVAETL